MGGYVNYLHRKEDCLTTVYDKERQTYVKVKSCRCAGCSYCQSGCYREIAAYPGVDPDDPEQDLTAGKFNGLKFCDGCRTARIGDRHREYMTTRRELTRSAHKALRLEAKAAVKAAEAAIEKAKLLEQQNALLKQENRRLGGKRPEPEAEKGKAKKDGIGGLVKRIAGT